MNLRKKIGALTLLIVVSFFSTACSESENKCDTQVNNELIKIILYKHIFGEENENLSKENESKILQKKINEKKPLYATMMNDKESMDGWSMLSVMTHKNKKENQLSREAHTIKIHSYLTINKDEALDKVQCGAIVDYKFSSTTQSFDIVYTSQPSKKEDEIELKITSLKKKN